MTKVLSMKQAIYVLGSVLYMTLSFTGLSAEDSIIAEPEKSKKIMALKTDYFKAIEHPGGIAEFARMITSGRGLNFTDNELAELVWLIDFCYRYIHLQKGKINGPNKERLLAIVTNSKFPMFAKGNAQFLLYTESKTIDDLVKTLLVAPDFIESLFSLRLKEHEIKELSLKLSTIMFMDKTMYQIGVANSRSHASLVLNFDNVEFWITCYSANFMANGFNQVQLMYFVRLCQIGGIARLESHVEQMLNTEFFQSSITAKKTLIDTKNTALILAQGWENSLD